MGTAYTADAKRGHVQSMGLMGYDCQGASSPKQFAAEDGAADSKRGHVQGLDLVGDECAATAPTKEVAGKNGFADAKLGHVQSMVLVGYACEGASSAKESVREERIKGGASANQCITSAVAGACCL